jgi:hypothetical protein
MRELAWLSAGAAIWAVHFGALYGMTAVACARGLSEAVPWTVAIGGATAAALLLTVIARARRGTFVGWIAAASAAAALFAVVLESAAGLLMPPCA